MSSFASLFVANANATPENVVPCSEMIRTHVALDDFVVGETYEVDSHNQLRLASAVALDLGGWTTKLLQAAVALVLRGGRWGIAGCTSVSRRTALHALRRWTTRHLHLRGIALNRSSGVNR